MGNGSAARRQVISVVLCVFSVLATACGRSNKPASPSPKDYVSIGYKTELKDEFIGAASSVHTNDLKVGPLVRIEELLEGRVAGLQVIRSNGEYTLRIRGSHYDPLIVVDGWAIDSGGLHDTLGGLTPHDIERIDVLKDAGSTAIYGARGANGVIIIKTKRRPSR